MWLFNSTKFGLNKWWVIHIFDLWHIQKGNVWQNFGFTNKIKSSNWIKKKELKINIFLLKNFLNKGDKLPKSKNQILWIKQLNIGNSKFNSLVSHINNGEFLQWKGLRIDKTILHGKRSFTKKKKLYKISLQVW